MSRINELQNTKSSLELLASQRCLYSQVKRILFYRGLLALGIAIAFPIISAAHPASGFYLALGAFTYLIADLVILQNGESRKKILAAKIQEKFDTEVLSIRWNPIVSEEKPDFEDVAKHGYKIFEREVDKLRNWYPPNVSSLPEELAKTICQRANVWWDSKLRRKYSRLLIILMAIITISLIIIVKDKTVAEAFVIVTPFTPLLKMAFEQFSSHRKSADRLDKLKNHLNTAIDTMTTKPSNVVQESTTRSIQDEIYRHRSSSTPIPSIFYWFFKKQYEDGMNFSANKFIEDYLAVNDLDRQRS